MSGSVKKKWHGTGNFSKEVPEFLRGHRRLYSTAFTEQPVKEKELAVWQLVLKIYVLSCQVTSQHPYCEEFIGAPHVYTIDVNVLSDVEKVIKEILLKEVF